MVVSMPGHQKTVMKKAVLVIGVFLVLCVHVPAQENFLLKYGNYKHYIDRFNEEDNELYREYYPNEAAWSFLQSNIPLMDCPDKNIELTYYFRWWTYRKHIKLTPDGFIITEFLPQ